MNFRLIKMSGLFFIAASGTIIFFQNCQGEMMASSKILENQSAYEAALKFDNKELPALLAKDNIQLWRKNAVVTMSKDSIFADANSVVLALNADTTGLIYSINSGDNFEDSQIIFENGSVRAVHKTDTGNYSFIVAQLPVQDKKITIAAAFGIKPNDISLLINGIVQNFPIQKVGSPLDYSLLLKQNALAQAFDLDGEVVVYANSLSLISLNVMSRYIAKTSNVALVLWDRNLTTPTTSVGAAPNVVSNPFFQAAKNIIDSKCIGCHNSSNNGDFRNLTQDQFLQKNLISAKSAAGSKIYYRLMGSTSGPGPGDMPRGGSISPAEVQSIADWINSI